MPTRFNGHKLMIGVALLVTLVFIGLSTYYFWRTGSSLMETTKMSNYLSLISLVGVMIALITLVIEYLKSVDDKEKEDLEAQLRQIQSNWIDLEKTFMTYYPYLVRLYAQIYGDNPVFKVVDLRFTPEEWQKVRIYEAHVCSILFQIIENVCLVSPEGEENPHYQDWLRIWRSWFKSPIVREQWGYMKGFYGHATRKCVETHMTPPPKIIG